MAQNIIEKWKLRFGETDADTRGAGRAPVNILPSRMAIVNVYQLTRKTAKGKSADKRRHPEIVEPNKKIRGGAKQKLTDADRAKRVAETTDRNEKKISKRSARYGDEKIPVNSINNEAYDIYGTPTYSYAGEPPESYNPRAKKFMLKYRMVELPGATKRIYYKETPQQKKETEVEEHKIKRDEHFDEMKKEATKEAIKLNKDVKKNDPLAILFKLVKENGVKTESGVKQYENDNNYVYKDPTDEQDFLEIKSAIINAKETGKLPYVRNSKIPPEVVAIQTGSMNVAPKRYYVRKISGTPRVKKLIYSKVKRPALRKKLVNRNKRRVVMKKGGKR